MEREKTYTAEMDKLPGNVVEPQCCCSFSCPSRGTCCDKMGCVPLLPIPDASGAHLCRPLPPPFVVPYLILLVLTPCPDIEFHVVQYLTTANNDGRRRRTTTTMVNREDR